MYTVCQFKNFGLSITLWIDFFVLNPNEIVSAESSGTFLYVTKNRCALRILLRLIQGI